MDSNAKGMDMGAQKRRLWGLTEGPWPYILENYGLYTIYWGNQAFKVR